MYWDGSFLCISRGRPECISPLQFNPYGQFTIAILRDDQMVSLTDMWKAASRQNHKKPSLWLNSVQAHEFIRTLAKRMGVEISTCLKTVLGKGKNQGTFAHWQIALAYAKYLSPLPAVTPTLCITIH